VGPGCAPRRCRVPVCASAATLCAMCDALRAVSAFRCVRSVPGGLTRAFFVCLSALHTPHGAGCVGDGRRRRSSLLGRLSMLRADRDARAENEKVWWVTGVYSCRGEAVCWIVILLTWLSPLLRRKVAHSIVLYGKYLFEVRFEFTRKVFILLCIHKAWETLKCVQTQRVRVRPWTA
jgi:hypothetical protein